MSLRGVFSCLADALKGAATGTKSLPYGTLCGKRSRSVSVGAASRREEKDSAMPEVSPMSDWRWKPSQ